MACIKLNHKKGTTDGLHCFPQNLEKGTPVLGKCGNLNF